MDRPQFEALLRRVSQASGRRPLLHALLLAPALTSVPPGGEDVAAGKRKRKKRKSCKAPKVRCGKACLPAGRCCTSAQCTQVTGQVCEGNTCACPAGQKVAGNVCSVPCTSVCGDCQRCDAGECVDLADGAACTDGGVCRNSFCKPDRSLGCTIAQNTCATGATASCPNNPVNNTFCFVDLDGDPVCAHVLCTNDATGAACPGLTGPGSFVQPCAALCIPNANKTHMCIKPVIA